MRKALVLLASVFFFASLAASLAGCTGTEVAQRDESKRMAFGNNVTYIIDDADQLWVYGINDGLIGLGNLPEDSGMSVEKITLPRLVMKDVQQICSGNSHILALKTDGSVWQWGIVNNQKIGTPIQVLQGAADITAASDGGLAVKSNGEVWAWGSSIYGVLTDDNPLAYHKPYSIMEEGARVYADGSCYAVLTTKGEFLQWGNLFGEMTTVPVKVTDGVTKVSFSSKNIYLLKKDRTLWGMGWNDFGQLGNGESSKDARNSFLGSPEPVRIDVNVTVMDANSNSGTLYFIKKGDLWGCGNNDCGQLGGGAETFQQGKMETHPVLIEKGVDRVFAGFHSIYFQKDKALWSSGRNDSGILGIGTPYEELDAAYRPVSGTPQKVLDGEVRDLLCGMFSMVCRTSDGQILLWGEDPLRYNCYNDGSEDTRNFTGELAELINQYRFVSYPVNLPLPNEFFKTIPASTDE